MSSRLPTSPSAAADAPGGQEARDPGETRDRPEAREDQGPHEAHDALLDLLSPFVPAGFQAVCDIVRADQIPPPANQLLVHHRHMTVELCRHHHQPVRVSVMGEIVVGDVYTRQISLAREQDGRVVEWGIARLKLQYLSDEVRGEILAKQSPLGAILIAHNVHRRIEPRHFLRFVPDHPVLKCFDPAGNAVEVFGRLGTIYCDDRAAIELLEIVVNV